MLAPYVHRKNGVSYLYTTYVFDTLVSQDADGNPAPGLARSWQRAPDGLSYAIQLQSDAKWHDGKAVTAEDVAFTMRYMSEYPYVFGSVKSIERVEVEGPYDLRVYVKRAETGLVEGVFSAIPILPEHVYSRIEDPFRFASLEAAIGSGPYRLAAYDKAQGRYLLEAVTDHPLGRARFEQIRIVKMNPDAALQAMSAGEVDIISYLPVDRVLAAEAEGFKVEVAPSHHVMRLGFNHRGRFALRELRQAIAYVIDRKALLDTAFPGTAELAQTGYFQPGSRWWNEDDNPTYAHDPAKAHKFLINAGWAQTAAGRWQREGDDVSLRLITDGRSVKSARVITEQLEIFGFSIDLRVMELGALRNLVAEGAYDLTLFSSSTLGDPSNIGRRVFGRGWNSDRFPADPEMTGLIRAQTVASSHAERVEALDQFQRLYAENLPSYMLVNPLMATTFNEKLSAPFMPGGVAVGIPSALHKSIFLE
ncbi:ABC transporter substrate-binding protein [Phaeobacter porticola]|uniref:ABC transporter substrate-binding protein n=1 Tax=Phaeobacter porticola TaxID=1844006 RepID=UPI001F1A7548|nr:ABC transporter substrate-binding protein [Phaeobacter porticola]